ncbi:DNA cytosine methyltransferase [Halomonas faecis]|uniref:DNA cytosine methyltransferase n=1 Tax=Halomonas faecis TaxID=1562110 RepID=UPI001969FA92|nr:DNA cytosine methyltransferase [Halomonas faecis]
MTRIFSISELSYKLGLVLFRKGHKILSMKESNLLTAFDLFSGCGGLSEGLRQSGFSVLAGVELDKKASETYRLNHPGVRFYNCDIREVDPREVMTSLGLRKGELGLIAGCPPCQGFSRLRTKNKSVSIDDDRNNLIEEFYRFVAALSPKSVMLENVPSLESDGRFVDVVSRLKALGYKCEYKVLDASDYSVPQRRKRLILLGAKSGKPSLAEKAVEKITVRKAIATLKNPGEGGDDLHNLPEKRSKEVRKIISMIPLDGGSRFELPKKHHLSCFKKSGGFRDVYGRMSWDKVSPTITSGCHNPSKGRFLHPSKNRAITLREAAILQGFPKSYRFDTSHGKESIALMIGNALPPPFIKAHAACLKEIILNRVG